MATSWIVVGTDLCVESDEAIRQAVGLARDRHRVALCHVLPDARVVEPLFPHLVGAEALASLDMQAWAREEIERCLSRVGNPDVDVYLEEGAPHVKIVERAKVLRAELLVIAAPQTTPQPNGTAAGVVRRAPMPVLVVRGSAFTPDQGRARGPVIAATDLSDPSASALALAARQADALGLPLVALHVIDFHRELAWLGAVRRLTDRVTKAYTDRMEALMENAGKDLAAFVAIHAPKAKAEILHGRAADVIRKRASDLDASLVVVGTHGRGGIDHLLVGSVAEDIVTSAPCSVLVTRHHS